VQESLLSVIQPTQC